MVYLLSDMVYLSIDINCIYSEITLNVTDMDMDRYTISVNRYAKELVTYMIYLSKNWQMYYGISVNRYTKELVTDIV